MIFGFICNSHAWQIDNETKTFHFLKCRLSSDDECKNDYTHTQGEITKI